MAIAYLWLHLQALHWFLNPFQQMATLQCNLFISLSWKQSLLWLLLVVIFAALSYKWATLAAQMRNTFIWLLSPVTSYLRYRENAFTAKIGEEAWLYCAEKLPNIFDSSYVLHNFSRNLTSVKKIKWIFNKESGYSITRGNLGLQIGFLKWFY